MKICVEKTYSNLEYPDARREATDVTLTYWPDGNIKSLWGVAGSMLSRQFKAHAYPTNKSGEEHLTVRVYIFHDQLEKGKTVDHAAKVMENELRRQLRLALKKVEKYLDDHCTLVSHITSLHKRVEALEESFREHKSITGRRPHGTRVGIGRSTWIKY